MNPAIAVGIGVFMFFFGVVIGGILERKLQRRPQMQQDADAILEAVKSIGVTLDSIDRQLYAQRHGLMLDD
jgi:hypothetical protein